LRYDDFMDEPPVSFEFVFRKYDWQEIKNCPGRWILSGGATPTPPLEFLGMEGVPVEFHSPAVPDPVVMIPFPGGGMISFHRPDGRWIHTLNTVSGFKRKETALALNSTAKLE